MKELLKDRNYWFGLTFGIFLMSIIINDIIVNMEWHWIYVAPYIVMSFFQLIVAGDDNEEGTHVFFLGANIPIFISIMILFTIVDIRNGKSTKNIKK